jgi:hypothetical protein
LGKLFSAGVGVGASLNVGLGVGSCLTIRFGSSSRRQISKVLCCRQHILVLTLPEMFLSWVHTLTPSRMAPRRT